VSTVTFRLGSVDVNLRLGVQPRVAFQIGPIATLSRNGAKGQRVMAKLILTVDQQCALAVQFVDSSGNPVPPKGGATWTVSDETKLTLTGVTPEGTAARIVAAGGLGLCQVAVRENEIGADNIAVTGALDVEVIAGEAMSAVITPGAPEPA
jgi:hypothetical protein